jgi:hypothetical protein
VWATIYRPFDLARMISGIFGGAVYTNLAPITVGMGAIYSSPMALFSPSPLLGFGIGDGLFDLWLGVAWSSHRRHRNLMIR